MASNTIGGQYSGDEIEDKLQEIPATSLYTNSLIFARTRGIEFGIFFVLTVMALQVLSILILGLSEAPTEDEMEFEHREWAVSAALLIFVIGCFAEFFDRNLVNIGFVFNVKCCFVQGRWSDKWMDFSCLNEPFNKTAVGYECKKCFIFCLLFVMFDISKWIGVVIVGGRLLVYSTSLQDVILNSLAAIFVLEIDDMLGKMLGTVAGLWTENKYYCLKTDSLRPFPSIKGLTLYFFFLVPIVPGMVVAALYYIPYW